MKISDVTKLQTTLASKINDLCPTPVATSQEEAALWRKNHTIYLREKVNKIKSLPDSLNNEVDRAFNESMNFYVRMITGWFDSSFEILNKNTLRDQKMFALFSKIRAESLLKTVPSVEEKVNFFIGFFEALVEKMKMQHDWFEFYQLSRIGMVSNRLIWNISVLDLFSWELPAADKRNINDYQKLAKLMTIFFFFEQIYKNEFRLDTPNNNPFKAISPLEKIAAYYAFVKDINALSDEKTA